MQFIYQPLTWAFLLVLVPLVIHLINLVRQQRVDWAAMEFLLKSYKKHRRWVWLKQFLLLLLRMFAVAVAVAMLAGLVTHDQAAFLGGQATHHFVLVDDSISMGDRSSDGTAFDRAMLALGRLAEQLAEQPSDQRVTLIRSSAVRGNDGRDVTVADMNAVAVDADFAETMEELKRNWEVTELAFSPKPALELLERLVANAVEQRKEVHILSDFRRGQWDQAAELKQSLRNLRNLDAAVQLVRCSEATHQNLGIVDIVPESGTLAAGVPLLVNVRVRNFGPGDAQQIPIRISATSFPSDVVVAEQVPEEQVTSSIIEQIPAGETGVRQAQLKFDRAGQHIVAATLGTDALLADNRRACLVDIPAAVPVLLVDGSIDAEESYYLESIFAPGRVVTGIQPVSRSPAYLRDVVDAELRQYAAIYLLNVEQLDGKAVSVLERYVAGGGGLAIFTGPNNDPAFLMELYRDGEGLFPLAIQSDRDHLHRPGDPSPDVQVNDHPIFRVLVDEGGKNRPLAGRIRVNHYFPVDPAWAPGAHPATEILATVQGGDPLVASRRFGAGVVVAFLTTASPTWNNWAMGPSYPVVILQLQAFLSAAWQTHQAALTGAPIQLQLDTTEFLPEAVFQPPPLTDAESSRPGKNYQASPSQVAPDSPLVTFTLGVPDALNTDRSGVYVANLLTVDRQPRQKRFVVNVPTNESDLALLEPRQLLDQFDGLGIEVHSVEELEYQSADQNLFSWSYLLTGLLVALLLGEQLLAYSASYHPQGDGGP